MRIGILLPSIYMSTQKYNNMIFAPRDLALGMADALVEKGHDVVLFATGDVKTKAKIFPGNEELLEGNFFIQKMKNIENDRNKWGTFYLIKKEYEIELTSKAFKYACKNLDIIHVYHDYFSHYFNEVVDIPCVYTLHDPMPPKDSLEYWRLMNFKHHNYISISDSHRESLDLNFIKTIYHGIDLSKYEFLNNQKNYNYLAFIGRPVLEKGLDLALKLGIFSKMKLKLAYNKSKELNKSAYYKKVKKLIKKTKSEEVGFLAEKEKIFFYQHAKATLFPIQWEEPFGMVLIESMACGTPVIAFARGSVPEIVKDGETGFIVNYSEEDKRGDFIVKNHGFEGLVEALTLITKMSRDDYEKMRTNCRKHIEDHFSFQRMINDYELLYKEIIKK